MKGVWIGFVVVVAAGTAALAGCGSSDTTGPGTSGLSGTWRFQESLADATAGITCSDTAQVALTQTGQTFTANYTQNGSCNAGGQASDNSGTGTISDGRIAGDSVSFSEDICAYRGKLSGNNAMSGTVACTDNSTGTPLTLSGNWTMAR